MKKTLFALLFVASLMGDTSAREWISADGRKLDAEFISAANDVVKLKRSSDGQTFSLPVSRLSAADQSWVREQGDKPAAPAKGVDGPYAKLLTGEWALSEFEGLPFAIFGSKDLDASKNHPLLLMLHGKSPNNENGKQLAGWMKVFGKPENQASHPCIIVAPLCYQPYGGTGGGWNDKPGTQAVELVKDLCKSLPVDKQRVYVAGYSMGAFGTCHLINSEPRLFAAGVAVAGCSGADSAGAFRKVPLWLFHAADDNIVNVQGSRELAEAMAKYKECKFTEFPTGGHGIVDKVFNDAAVRDWLFSHGTGKSAKKP